MFKRWYSEITTMLLQLSDQYRGPWDSDWPEPEHGIPTSPAWTDTGSLAAWQPLLAPWKHTAKILRCFSHEPVPGYYSYPVLMQWILKTQLQNFHFYPGNISHSSFRPTGQAVGISCLLFCLYPMSLQLCHICKFDNIWEACFSTSISTVDENIGWHIWTSL